MWVLAGGWRLGRLLVTDNDDNNISDRLTHTNPPPHAKASDGRLYTVQEAFGLPSSFSSSSSASREEEGEDDCIVCLTERKVWMEWADGWVDGAGGVALIDLTPRVYPINHKHTGGHPPPLPALLRLRALPPLPRPLPRLPRPFPALLAPR